MELGSSAYFWEATGGGDVGAAYWNLINSKDDLMRAEDFESTSFSLRCVQDTPREVVNDSLLQMMSQEPAKP